MDAYAATRHSLHAISEGILAGPQYERSGTIRLRLDGESICTIADPALRLLPHALVGPDGTQHPLRGAFGELAERAGVSWTVPTIYGDHASLGPADEIDVDEAAAARLIGWLADGAQALSDFSPEETPVLWPEHFDVGITVDEVNFGVSPGDSYSPEPYAYVGPWGFTEHEEEFFNAPFGAIALMHELRSTAVLVQFFVEGARLWTR